MYSFRQTIDIVGMVVYVFETPCKLPTLQYRGHFEGTRGNAVPIINVFKNVFIDGGADHFPAKMHRIVGFYKLTFSWGSYPTSVEQSTIYRPFA